jgi:hypothetical protein
MERQHEAMYAAGGLLEQTLIKAPLRFPLPRAPRLSNLPCGRALSSG